MRHLAKVSLCVILILSLGGALPAAKKEYFTDAELELIREAQELKLRIPAYFKLAERRLIFLGVMEQSEKEKERERKEREKREKELKKGAKANQLPPVDDLAYLDEFTPSELLHGYMQALDEVMSNIDDYYNRKLEVRDSLEDLEKFTRETIPLLQKFKPRNAAESAALEAAVDKAKQSLADATEALKTVPKTEKKRKP